MVSIAIALPPLDVAALKEAGRAPAPPSARAVAAAAEAAVVDVKKFEQFLPCVVVCGCCRVWWVLFKFRWFCINCFILWRDVLLLLRLMLLLLPKLALLAAVLM